MSTEEQAAIASISAEFGLQVSSPSRFEAISSQKTLSSIVDLRTALKRRSDQILQPLMVTEINELLQGEGFQGGIEDFLAATKQCDVLDSVSALRKIFDVLSAASSDCRQASIELANNVLSAISAKKIPKETGRQLVESLRKLQSALHVQLCQDNVPIVISAYDDSRYRFASFSFQEAGSSITNRKHGTSSRLFKLQLRNVAAH